MKKLISLLLAVAVLVSLVACDFSGNHTSSAPSAVTSSDDKPQPFPVTVRDVTVGTAPSRVVSLSPLLTELICSFGYEDRLIGRSSNCIFSTSVTRLPDLGTAAEPKLEEIIKLSPEYVFTSQKLSDYTVEWLTKNNIAVFTADLPSSIEELTGLYSDLAVFFEGKTDGIIKGAKHEKDFSDKLKELKLKIEKYRSQNQLTDAVSVMLVYALNNYIAAGQTLENEILEYIGIGNAASEYVGYYVSDDDLKTLNPHYIVTASDIGDLSKNKAYKAKTAVKKGNLVSVDTTPIEKRSPQMLSVFYEIAEAMYPGVGDVALSEPSAEEVSSEPSAEESSSEQ